MKKGKPWSLTVNGRTQNLKEWCDELGLKYSTVFSRVNKYGISPEVALTMTRPRYRTLSPDTTHRICSSCRKHKPLESFPKSNDNSLGRGRECKLCLKERTRRHYQANRERLLEQGKQYSRSHPERGRHAARLRAARKKGAIGRYSRNEWEALKAEVRFACLACGRTEPEVKLTVDHIQPLIAGGTNYITNIQPLCRSCNCSKQARTLCFCLVRSQTLLQAKTLTNQ